MNQSSMGILKKEFARSFRGYNITEVNEFLEKVATSYEGLLEENKELRDNLNELKEQYNQLQQYKEDTQKSLQEAQEEAEKAKAEAREEIKKIKAEAEESINSLKQDYAKLQQENEQQQEKLSRLAEKNKNYEKMENTVQSAILVAQEAAEEIKKNAYKEADIIQKEAEQKAQGIIDDARYQASRILAENESLHKQMQIFKMRFRSFIEAQLSSLEMEDWSEALPGVEDYNYYKIGGEGKETEEETAEGKIEENREQE